MEKYRSELSALEGSARLLLPTSLLELHEESISAFNTFKNVMNGELYDDKYHVDKEAAFKRIEDIKCRMEASLRKFLRTEHMVSPSEA